MATQRELFESVLQTARKLPLGTRRRLAEQLLQEASEAAIVVYLRQLPADKQARLDKLLEAGNRGLLTNTDRIELDALIAESDQLTLENAEALARTQFPELFGKTGRPHQRRIDQFIRSKSKPAPRSIKERR